MAEDQPAGIVTRGIIQDIEFQHARKAIPRTTIFLSPDVTHGAVAPLTQFLASQNLQVRPAIVNRKWALKITSPVLSEQTLLVALKSGGFIDDRFETQWEGRQRQKEIDEAPKGGFKKTIAKVAGNKEQRLQRAGIAYAIGDWIGMGIGAVNKHWGDFAFGFFAHLGTLPWIFYGRDKTGMTAGEKIIDDMRYDFTRHQKAPYAQDVWLAPPKNAKDGFDTFMYRHAYNIGALFNLISSPPLAKAGFDQHNWSKFASGILNTSGWAVNLFVTPEGEKGAVDWGRVSDSLGIGTEYRKLKGDAMANGTPLPEKKHSALSAPLRAIGDSIHKHTHLWGSVFMLTHNINMLFFSTFKDIFYGQAEKHDIARRYGQEVPAGKPENVRAWFFKHKLWGDKEPPDVKHHKAQRLPAESSPEFFQDAMKQDIRQTYNAEHNPTRAEWAEICKHKKYAHLANEKPHWTHLKSGYLWWDGELEKHLARCEERLRAKEYKAFEKDVKKYDEKSRLKFSGWLTAAMIGSYLAGGLLIGSVKGDAGKKINLDEIYSDAALLLLKQKDQVYQIALLADMTQYLSEHPELQKLKLSQVQIVEGIVQTAVAIAQGPLLAGEEHARAEAVVKELSEYGQTVAAKAEAMAPAPKKQWSAAQPAPAAGWTQEVTAAPVATVPAR